jgi:hypothetical protein
VRYENLQEFDDYLPDVDHEIHHGLHDVAKTRANILREPVIDGVPKSDETGNIIAGPDGLAGLRRYGLTNSRRGARQVLERLAALDHFGRYLVDEIDNIGQRQGWYGIVAHGRLGCRVDTGYLGLPRHRQKNKKDSKKYPQCFLIHAMNYTTRSVNQHQYAPRWMVAIP